MFAVGPSPSPLYNAPGGSRVISGVGASACLSHLDAARRPAATLPAPYKYGVAAYSAAAAAALARLLELGEQHL